MTMGRFSTFQVQLDGYLREAEAALPAVAEPARADEVRQAVEANAPNISDELRQAISAAQKKWRESGGGERFIQALAAAPIDDWPGLHQQLMNEPVFSEMREATATQNKKVGLSDLSPVKSFISEIGGDIDFLFVTGGASIVFATDADTGTQTTVSIVVRAGLGEGLGVEAGVEMGISGATPDESGGCGIGIEASLSGAVGLAATASVAVDVLPQDFRDLLLSMNPLLPTIKPKQWSLTFGAGLGLEEEIAVFAEVGYIIANLTNQPVEQPAGKHMARIFEVKCDEVAAHLNTDKDKIYLEFTPDTNGQTYRYPQMGEFSIGLKSGENIWRCSRSVSFNNSFQLKVKIEGKTLAKWDVEWPIRDLTQDSSGFNWNYTDSDESDLVNEIKYKVSINHLF